MLIYLQVRIASEHHTSFVALNCGHSPFSHIGSEGVLLDLSGLPQVVSIDTKTWQVTVRGAVAHKRFQEALSDHGRCARKLVCSTLLHTH